MTVVHNILCLLVFTLDVSLIFPLTKLKCPPPPPQVIEFVKSIGRYPYWILISFKGSLHIIEKNDKQATLLIANEVTELSEVASAAEL